MTRMRANMLADEAERLRMLATIVDCSELPAEPLPQQPDEHSPGIWFLGGAAIGLAIDVGLIYVLIQSPPNFFGPKK